MPLHRSAVPGLALVAFLAAAGPVAGKTFAALWTTGTSAGATVMVSQTDLVARADRDALNVVFSAKQAFMRDLDVDTDHGWVGAEWHVRSVVGPILSFEESVAGMSEGAAHPMAVRKLLAVDLARQGRPASLTDHFPDAHVLAALKQDKLVRQALASIDPEAAPKTSAALVGILGNWSEDCRYGFDKDMLSHFAFHHVEGKKVAVRIGLSHGCEAARGLLTELGLLLPIPPALAGPLARAAARSQGVLMKDAGRIPGAKHVLGNPDKVPGG